MSAYHRCLCRSLLAAALLLDGCAGQQAQREGLQLISQGQVEAGLAALERASREAPNDPDLRATLYRQREIAIGQFLAQAEALRASNNTEQSAAAYNRVLALDPSNQRARAGLDLLDTGQRQAAMVAEARVLLAQGNIDASQAKVRAVLAENPVHREARALNYRIGEIRSKSALAEKSLKADFRKPATVEVRDASLRTVFELLSRSAGINFVFDKDVRADLKTTIFMRDKSIDDIISILLVTNQLDKKIVDENTIIIYPSTPAKAREYLNQSVRAFYLTNAEANQVVNAIRSVLKTRDLVADEKLNLVVMRDTPESIRLAEKLVALQDQPEPEVVLELEVLEISVGRLQNLGIRFPDRVAAGFQGAAGVPGQFTLDEWQNNRSNIVQFTITDPALVLNLKRTDANASLLANPRVRVRNREKAMIHVGERVPVITSTLTSTGVSAGSVSYMDVGLKLEIESNVSLDDEVAMRLRLEVSNILETVTTNSTTSYRLGTRNAATTLRLKNGETQILAGLIQNDERKTANKVPGFGDLPIIGRLFSSNLDESTKTEIVLLITPRVVRNIVRPDADAVEFSSGTDASLGAGSGSGVSASIPLLSQPPPQQPTRSPASAPGAQLPPFPAFTPPTFPSTLPGAPAPAPSK